MDIGFDMMNSVGFLSRMCVLDVLNFSPFLLSNARPCPSSMLAIVVAGKKKMSIFTGAGSVKMTIS